MRRLLLAALPILIATQARAADRRITLINASSQQVDQFYAVKIGQGGDQDILGERVLLPGQSVVINFPVRPRECKFDFLVVMHSGTRVMKRNVDICEIEAYRITD